MRNEFCSAMVEAARHPDCIFMTGDLGYAALEPLQAALGSRFHNVGISEQNMVSVAAGLAMSGLKAWVYSIAPFLYARPYEQIRNDVCLHNLPVKLVGNGGGYGYGVMGSSHHAIEDYGALLCLQNMRAYIPAFGEDIAAMVDRLLAETHPAYLRLGRDSRAPGFGPYEYAAWRRLIGGSGPTVLAIGPFAGALIAPMSQLPDDKRPSLWVVSELPITAATIPQDFLADLDKSGKLLVAEEHVAQGSVASSLALVLATAGITPRRFIARHAVGYPSGLYGSQAFHQQESGLDPTSIMATLVEM